jgi:hypothetical protein
MVSGQAILDPFNGDILLMEEGIILFGANKFSTKTLTALFLDGKLISL